MAGSSVDAACHGLSEVARVRGAKRERAALWCGAASCAAAGQWDAEGVRGMSTDGTRSWVADALQAHGCLADHAAIRKAGEGSRTQRGVGGELPILLWRRFLRAAGPHRSLWCAGVERAPGPCTRRAAAVRRASRSRGYMARASKRHMKHTWPMADGRCCRQRRCR
eukprot:7384223-Prymnesium_polylepis.2